MNLTLPPAKHSVFLYETADDFVSWMAPFVTEGAEAGEAVIAVASEQNLAALREEVGFAPLVYLVSCDEWYARPSDTMGRWVTFAEDQYAAGRPGIRIIGEVVWPEDPALDWEMKRFETASTLAWVDRAALVVCPYNTRLQPERVIDAALQVHPGVIQGGKGSANAHFVPPEELIRYDSLPRLTVPDGGTTRRFEEAELAEAAAFLEEQARLAELAEPRVQSLVAAATEVAVNAFVHARSQVHISAWREAGNFLCQFDDEGPGIADLSVGYQPPYGADDRWGLWLARSRTDGIEIGRSASGTAVRLTMRV